MPGPVPFASGGLRGANTSLCDPQQPSNLDIGLSGACTGRIYHPSIEFLVPLGPLEPCSVGWFDEAVPIEPRKGCMLHTHWLASANDLPMSTSGQHVRILHFKTRVQNAQCTFCHFRRAERIPEDLSVRPRSFRVGRIAGGKLIPLRSPTTQQSRYRGIGCLRGADIPPSHSVFGTFGPIGAMFGGLVRRGRTH